MSRASWTELLKESTALFRECGRVDALPPGKEREEAMKALQARARQFSLKAPVERIQAVDRAALKALERRST